LIRNRPKQTRTNRKKTNKNNKKFPHQFASELCNTETVKKIKTPKKKDFKKINLIILPILLSLQFASAGLGCSVILNNETRSFDIEAEQLKPKSYFGIMPQLDSVPVSVILKRI
jgi:hypothetical protein